MLNTLEIDHTLRQENKNDLTPENEWYQYKFRQQERNIQDIERSIQVGLKIRIKLEQQPPTDINTKK